MEARPVTRFILLGALVLGLSAAAAAGKPESLRQHGADLDESLEWTHRTLPSFHFLLRYPKSVSEERAAQVIEVLEAELYRLQAWIPHEGGPERSLEVQLFHAEDFEQAYGDTVIGIYDGRLRVPIVDSGKAAGVVTSTLTHELVHALVARLNGSAVPLWLQEGLAQFLERDHEFPEPSRLAGTDPLPLQLLDEILVEAANPAVEVTDPVLVERAYRESVWTLHFISQRFGVSGIRRLLKAYAEGHGDESALVQAYALSRIDFERSLRKWYRQGPPGWLGDDKEPDEPDPEAKAVWANVFDWHGYYRSQIRPLKSALRQVVEEMRRPGSVRFGASCRRFLADLAALFSDEAFFYCPDENVSEKLIEAFQRLEELGRSCQARRSGRMAQDLASAESALEAMAARLATYGLQP